MICRHYLVDGKVQGVFYRASTQQQAQRLGLTGWVRNRQDGRVELVACGNETALNELEAWLHEGPGHARVDSVIAESIAHEVHATFDVRY
ncbi:MAG: acylphosphatase [Gammaproteobacteria bacterium]|nr:acylphosphatase [Gammaproteobacteria bacterium]